MERARPLSTRRLGLLTGALGVLLVWAFSVQSLYAAPLAVAFAGVAFWWSLHRPDPGLAQPVELPPRCAGCAAGCPECREHIEA